MRGCQSNSMLESPHPIAAVATSKRRRSRCVAASRTPRRTTAPVVGSLASRWIETWRGTRSHTRTRCAISHPRATAIGSLRMDASGTSSGSSPGEERAHAERAGFRDGAERHAARDRVVAARARPCRTRTTLRADPSGARCSAPCTDGDRGERNRMVRDEESAVHRDPRGACRRRAPRADRSCRRVRRSGPRAR